MNTLKISGPVVGVTKHDGSNGAGSAKMPTGFEYASLDVATLPALESTANGGRINLTEEKGELIIANVADKSDQKN